MTPAGLEPAIPGSVGRCLIHWATGPIGCQQYRTTFSIYSQAPASAGKPEHALSHPTAPRRPQAERSGSQKATTRPANHKELFQTLVNPNKHHRTVARPSKPQRTPWRTSAKISKPALYYLLKRSGCSVSTSRTLFATYFAPLAGGFLLSLFSLLKTHVPLEKKR